MKKLNNFLITSIFTLSIFLGNFTVTNEAEGSYLRDIFPASINNDASIQLTINGYGFEPFSRVFIDKFELIDVLVSSSTKITGTVPKGIMPGVYDVRVLKPKDTIEAVFPDAITVYGENLKLLMLDYSEKQIPGGVQMRMTFNKPVRVKGLSGPTDQELKTVIRKPFSTEHIIPFTVDLEDNLKFYIFKVEIKDQEGNEIEKQGTYRVARSGIKNDEKEVLTYSFPDLEFTEGKANLSFRTSLPTNLKVEKKLFFDDTWKAEMTDGDYNDIHEFSVFDLIPDNLYYVKVSGETEGGDYKFEEDFKFVFTKSNLINTTNPDDSNGGKISISTISKIWPSLSEEKKDIVLDEADSIEAVSGESNTEPKKEIESILEVDKYNFSEFENEDLSRFIPEVKELVDNGIIKGDEGFFYPRRAVTRAEFAVMICRSSAYDLKDAKAYFVDVPSSHFSFDCLSKLVEDKIIRGHGDGSFQPDSIISRGEAMTMLTRVFDIEPATKFADVFSDVTESYSLWSYVLAGYNEGWMMGKTFRPNDFLKRIEAFNLIAVTYGFSKSIEIDDFGADIEGVSSGSIEVVAPVSKSETEADGVVPESSTKEVVTQGDDEKAPSDEELGLDEELLKLLENLV